MSTAELLLQSTPAEAPANRSAGDVTKPHHHDTHHKDEDVTESTAWMDSLASLGFHDDSSMNASSSRRNSSYHHSDKDFIFEDPQQLLQVTHNSHNNILAEEKRASLITTSNNESEEDPLKKLRHLVQEETDLVHLLLQNFANHKKKTNQEKDKHGDAAADDDGSIDLMDKIDDQCQIYRTIASKLLVEHTLTLNNTKANENVEQPVETMESLQAQLDHAKDIIAMYQEQAALVKPRLDRLPDELTAMQQVTQTDTKLMRTLVRNVQQRDQYIHKLHAMLDRYRRALPQQQPPPTPPTDETTMDLLKFRVQSLTNDLAQRNLHIETLQGQLQQVQQSPPSPQPPSFQGKSSSTMRELYLHSRQLQQQVDDLTKDVDFYKHRRSSKVTTPTKQDSTTHMALQQSQRECAALKRQIQALQQQQQQQQLQRTVPSSPSNTKEEQEEEKREIDETTELNVNDLQVEPTDSQEMNSWVNYF